MIIRPYKRFHLLALLVVILVLLSSSALSKQKKHKKKKPKKQHQSFEYDVEGDQPHQQLKKHLREDEGHLVEPYLGGYNSQKATMLQVTFHPFETIRKEINPRWRELREMIEDTQKMLLTGGVKTNIFRDKKQEQNLKDDSIILVYILNDTQQLEQAKEFLTQLEEVQEVKTLGQDTDGGRIVYGADEL